MYSLYNEHNPLAFLQKNFYHLQMYINGKGNEIDLTSIKRSLLVKQHESNSEIPDHYYEQNNNAVFYEIETFSSIFTKAIPNFATEFITIDFQNNLYLKEDKLLEWQNLIADLSPLLLAASFLANKSVPVDYSIKSVTEYYKDFIINNFRNTALLSPKIKPIENLYNNKCGFYDLHIHLNGIAESDSVWQNLLLETNKNLNNIKLKVNETSFLQQKQQIGIECDLNELINRAKKIRYKIFNIINCESNNDTPGNYKDGYNPFKYYFNNPPENKETPNNELGYECLMYVLIIKYLEETNSDYVASLFYEYLLIYGYFEELLVHNSNLYGFEQFQHITRNDIRSQTDEYQLNKFLQLSGNNFTHIKYIELRFSPKNNIDKMNSMISNIERDWNKFCQLRKKFLKCSGIGQSANCNELDLPRYNLVAHFIKKKEPNNEYKNIRFLKLRRELKSKSDTLKSYINRKNELSKKIVGVDAAASEFDTPPEVFAPIFRDLRYNKIISHFTYHAGEDFYHILGGLRNIYECLIYFDMKNGDRIGHASATGVNIETWLSIVGQSIYIPQGIYMDDLVFTYYFILKKIKELQYLLPKIVMRINELSNSIYKKVFDINILVESWKLRYLEPISDVNGDIIGFKDFDKIKINISCNKIEPKDKYNKDVINLLVMYNNSKIRKDYDHPILIDTEEIVTAKEMNLMQLKMLEVMHQNEIVIETLPTSNLRIGYHRSFKTYQLLNWYKWEEEGHPIPPIVLGTDDPGIFETNIYNEYSMVFCYLVYNEKKPRDKVLTFIKTIFENSETYAFGK